MISDSFEASKKWIGFQPNNGRFFAINGYLFVVIENSWDRWLPNGQKDISHEQIGASEIETEDEPNGDESDSGAIIKVENNKYAKVIGNKVCNLYFKDNEISLSRKCVPIAEDKNGFPPNIVSAIKTKDNNWYFINKNGKYCKRTDKNNSGVIVKNNY